MVYLCKLNIELHIIYLQGQVRILTGGRQTKKLQAREPLWQIRSNSGADSISCLIDDLNTEVWMKEDGLLFGVWMIFVI